MKLLCGDSQRLCQNPGNVPLGFYQVISALAHCQVDAATFRPSRLAIMRNKLDAHLKVLVAEAPSVHTALDLFECWHAVCQQIVSHKSCNAHHSRAAVVQFPRLQCNASEGHTRTWACQP